MFMDMLMSALRIGVAVYMGLCLLVVFKQSRYVYYPDRNVGLTPAYLGMKFEDVRLTTGDGETLAAWYVPAAGTNSPADSAPTLLFCHGNAGDIGDRLDSLLTFHNMGLNVFIFDYRGYGESTGKPTEQGTYNDALAAWDYVTGEKGVATNRVVLFGRSLGGSVCTWLAARVQPGLLAIESTFASAPAMAKRMFPILPARLLCRFKYDSEALLPEVRCPVLVLHSREDEMVPCSHGRRLFEAAREPKKFIEMRGGHNFGGLDGNPQYQAAFREFLTQHLR